VAFSLRQAGKNYGDDCGGARGKQQIFIAEGDAGKAVKMTGRGGNKTETSGGEKGGQISGVSQIVLEIV
jgi:hypothetical protein